MLVDPDVLVMDEPTSSLDILHEKALLKTLAEAYGDKILILVSHRSSTLTGRTPRHSFGAGKKQTCHTCCPMISVPTAANSPRFHQIILQFLQRSDIIP